MREKIVIGVAKWAKKNEDMFVKIQKLAADLDLDKKDLEKIGEHGEKPISLVFAGQYSAGKSTIIKALTGLESIATGAGITTQEAHIYNWNGLQVIDTPGIHTTLRPEHDAISYKAIAEADILVYVVTQELFNDEIGHDFRHLLIDQDKKKEMILVVNKMADIGNTPENQEIKRKDLEKVTEPATPEEVHTVFIDAESYLDSRSETDPEVAEELRIRSNFQQLVDTLNMMAKEQGIQARLTTMLYSLCDYLQRNSEKYNTSSGSIELDMVEESLRQQRHIYWEERRAAGLESAAIIREAASKIRNLGGRLADSMDEWSSEEEAKAKLQEAYDEVEHIAEECGSNMTDKVKEMADTLKEKLENFSLTDFSKDLSSRLQMGMETEDSLVKELLKEGIIEKSGKYMVQATTKGGKATAKGLQMFTNTDMHSCILGIGRFFGHKFIPWEAVKLAKGINVAGKALGVFGAVASVYFQYEEDQEAKKREQEMRRNRELIRAGFNDASCALKEHFEKGRSDILKIYDEQISDIDNKLRKIENNKTQTSEAYRAILQAEQDCQSLIKEIHDEF